MPPNPPPDSGPEFEKRALALARAIHDPSGQQGSVVIDGQERDGVFIDARSVIVFEFTTLRTKDKAEKDGAKLRDLIRKLSSTGEHRHKIFQGFFVTLDEPTADQRDVVTEISRKSTLSIAAVSYLTLRRQLIDTEGYLAVRSNAPFGSKAYKLPGSAPGETYDTYVDPVFASSSGGQSTSIEGIQSLVASGFHVVVTGDFGAGKSEALYQLYMRDRKAYFKKPNDNRFPVHINLRDCYGLRTPSEILRRHAEEIGFSDDRSLIAAWRAGACNLLLDGFDELVPSRWVGGARDLNQVRWNALEPVRRIVQETPANCGVVISGRAQFFSSAIELQRCVGIVGGTSFSINDFDTSRVNAYLGGSQHLPEWVPTRPLLLRFLAQNGLISDVDANVDPASAWLAMMEAIATRESDRITSVTPESTLALLARIATTARNELGAGTISTDEMRGVFREICGYEADEEGLQLLLRLPGLAASDGGNRNFAAESRRFVDPSLADALYGIDLAGYIAAPYANHPLSMAVTWSQTAGPLASQVAAAKLEQAKFEPGIVSAPVRDRLNKSLFDCVLVDCVQVGVTMNTQLPRDVGPFFSEVLIADLHLRGSDLWLEVGATYKDCLIERLDVSEVEDA
ncbi:MAG: uncharacterized protein JWM76_1120, partial [Pseudonocardiales bacterium]|nr:uncharacterized protein [Pseudonocardiales bacterium]